MRVVEHTIDIPAPPTRVWRLLTDTKAYEQWNPFMTRVDGVLAQGQRLTVTIRPGARTMTFRPTILAVEPVRLIRWQGRLGIPGIFDGNHELRLEPTPDGRSRFTQRETFSGILVPFLRGMLDDTASGFAAMNGALKARAVAHHEQRRP